MKYIKFEVLLPNGKIVTSSDIVDDDYTDEDLQKEYDYANAVTSIIAECEVSYGN